MESAKLLKLSFLLGILLPMVNEARALIPITLSHVVFILLSLVSIEQPNCLRTIMFRLGVGTMNDDDSVFLYEINLQCSVKPKRRRTIDVFSCFHSMKLKVIMLSRENIRISDSMQYGLKCNTFFNIYFLESQLLPIKS